MRIFSVTRWNAVRQIFKEDQYLLITYSTTVAVYKQNNREGFIRYCKNILREVSRRIKEEKMDKEL
jgi:hypothetical protein